MPEDNSEEKYVYSVISQFPHCDSRVLYAPGRCSYLSRILAEARCIVDTRGVFRDEQGRPLKDPKIYRI